MTKEAEIVLEQVVEHIGVWVTLIVSVLPVLAAIVAVVYLFGVIVVREGTIRVTMRFGQYVRVLRPGINILWPFETIVHLHYDEVEEAVDGTSKIIKRDMSEFPVKFTKMDPPPSRVRTQNNSIVNVNTAFWWRFVEARDQPFAFLTRVENPINRLAETYKQAVAASVDTIAISDRTAISGKELPLRIRETFIKMLEEMPFIEIGQVIIQSVGYPREMEERLSQDANRAQEYAAQLKQVDVQAKIAEANAAIVLAKARCDAEAQRIRATGHAAGLNGILRSIMETGIDKSECPKVYESYVRQGLYARGAGNVDTSIVLTPDFSGTTAQRDVTSAVITGIKAAIPHKAQLSAPQ